MNILVVCHRFPYPPNHGGKIRPFHVIHHLHAKHSVTVASLVLSSEEEGEAAGLAAHCTHFEAVRVGHAVQTARMLTRLPTSTPSSMGYFYAAHLARRVRHLIATGRFDLIFVHSSSVAQYVVGARGIPKILDFCDMDSQKWLQYARYQPFPWSVGYWLEGTKLRREEKRLAARFEACTTATAAEWQTLQGYGVEVCGGWFHNGVDTEYFAPDDQPYDADTISFVGRMDYYPNQQCVLDFCAATMPLIRARRPQAKFLIVGERPSTVVKKLGLLPGVTVTGSVRDVRPFVRRSAVMAAPLIIARGTQNKILESMALGVPVVTSPLAAAGVDAISAEHLLVAATPAEQAAAVIRLLEDSEERSRLAHAGRSRILTHHSWERSMQTLDGIIERCVHADGRGVSRNC